MLSGIVITMIRDVTRKKTVRRTSVPKRIAVMILFFFITYQVDSCEAGMDTIGVCPPAASNSPVGVDLTYTS